MKYAIEILRAKHCFDIDGETRGGKIAAIGVIVITLLMATLFAFYLAFLVDDYYAGFTLIICCLAWLTFLNGTGIVESNVKMHNERMTINQKKMLFYLPFTHKDFVRSVYISWLKVFGLTILSNAEYWLIIFITGKEPVVNGLAGLTTLCIYLIGTVTGIYVIASQFYMGKAFKVVTMIGKFFGWIIYFASLSLSFDFIGEAIEKALPQGFFDIFKPFCSPYSLLGIVLVPALAFGVMQILLACDRKRSWMHN